MKSMIGRRAQDTKISASIGIFLLLFLGGLFILALGFDTIQPSHRGVMVRFGQILGIFKVGDSYTGMKWTGLFTDVYSYDMRTRKVVIELSGDNYAPTKEGQKIFATINVNFRVRDTEETIKDLYAKIGSDDIISDKLNINAIITEGFKQATVGYTALEILEKRQIIKEKAIENIRTNFPAEYFEIETIVITNIAFTPEFANEIELKQKAIQTAQKEQNLLEAVKFQQQQKIVEYEAQAKLIQLQSVALTEMTLKQKMLDKWDGILPQYLIMTDQSSGMFLQLAKGELKVTGE
jgi:regulator of protease activity HflC (stomatin/prohibitin superfamily)